MGKKKWISNRVIQGESSHPGNKQNEMARLRLVTLLTLARDGSFFSGPAHFALLAVSHKPNSKTTSILTEIIQ